MHGFGDDTYGEAFADVYDDWYAEVSDVAATVAAVRRLAGERGTVVELGVGTGRLAIPLAATGLEVSGIDTSPAMLARLADKPGGHAVHAVLGDMVEALDAMSSSVDVVLVAYNTLFSLPTAERQRECFRAAAARLAPGGTLVVEAFVPVDDHAGPTDEVRVRSLTADRVVLSIDRSDPRRQVAEGQHVELSAAHGVRLRPWRIRWSTPAQLDAMAEAEGLSLCDRWADFAGAPFDGDSSRHVSIYRPVGNRPSVHRPSGDAS